MSYKQPISSIAWYPELQWFWIVLTFSADVGHNSSHMKRLKLNTAFPQRVIEHSLEANLLVDSQVIEQNHQTRNSQSQNVLPNISFDTKILSI